MWPLTSPLGNLMPLVPYHEARPREPTGTHTLTGRLTAEQQHAIAAALLAVGVEGLVHQHGPAYITGNIAGPQNNALHSSCETLHGRTGIRDTSRETTPPGPQLGEALVVQVARHQAVLHGFAGGYRSHLLADSIWTIWLAVQGRGPSCPPRTGDRRRPRRTT